VSGIRHPWPVGRSEVCVWSEVHEPW
jgi:hypothetical protein